MTGLGMRRPEVERFLDPAQQLIDDARFWRHQDRGLAVYVGRGEFHACKVPVELEEKVVVGNGFHILPLLPALGPDRCFLVVALSAGNTRIFEANRFAMRPVDGLAIPHSVEQVAAETDFAYALHASPVARPRTGRPAAGIPKTHATETPEELRKALLIEYLRKIAAGMDTFIAGRPIPVVLAAQDEVRGNLLAIGHLNHSPVFELNINPDALGEDDLHRRAHRLIRPALEKEIGEEIDRFYSLYNDGSARHRPPRIRHQRRSLRRGRGVARSEGSTRLGALR